MNTAAVPPLPLAEVTRRAIQVLSRELGAADAARFVGQFSAGLGDYTAERDELFAGLTLDQLTAEIRAMNRATGSNRSGEPSQ